MQIYEQNSICQVNDCERKPIAKGYCHKHYMRLRTHDDPTMTLTDKGNGFTPEERFWSKVNKNGQTHPYDPSLGSCWEWKGLCLQSSGHGQITVAKKHWVTHRYSWFLLYDEDPPQMLLHSCDNAPCVNPAHLRKGGAIENMRDKVERKRSASGERNGAAKLTNANVEIIRQNLVNGQTQKSQAELFGVGTSTINRISKGTHWKI